VWGYNVDHQAAPAKPRGRTRNGDAQRGRWYPYRCPERLFPTTTEEPRDMPSAPDPNLTADAAFGVAHARAYSSSILPRPTSSPPT
jgi:hypothetical protein